MQVFLSFERAGLVARLWIQIKVDVSADLSEDSLLDSCELCPEHVNIEVEISNDLPSLLTIHIAEASKIALRASIFGHHAEAQDLLIFLLNDLLFIMQIFPELVKSVLDVLHVFFDSLDIDGCMLLWAVVPLGSHR